LVTFCQLWNGVQHELALPDTWLIGVPGCATCLRQGKLVEMAGTRTRVWAFNMIELDGEDLRRDSLEVRKATLAIAGIRFNEHMKGDGPTVLKHACKLGLKVIVSKRKDPRYSSGRALGPSPPTTLFPPPSRFVVVGAGQRDILWNECTG
jgi:hypothetical protein